VKAAIVEQAGRTPVYGDFKELVPSTEENRIAVTAAALSPVVKARAPGTHYSSSGGFPVKFEARTRANNAMHFFVRRTIGRLRY
jgi:hypothetical protein